MARSENDANKWGRTVKRGIAVGTAAIAGATSAAVILGKKNIALSDSIAKNARVAGLAAETFQAWEFAASQSGVSNEKFASSLERATKRIGEAADGTGAAKDILDKYGISVFNLEGQIRPTESILRDFADVMQNIESPAERSAAAAALLGREGVRLGLLFEQGTSGLRRFESEARSLGAVIDQDILDEAEKAGDELDRLSKVIDTSLIIAFRDLIPVIGDASEAMATSIANFVGFTDSILGFTQGGKIESEILFAQAKIQQLNVLIDRAKARQKEGDSVLERGLTALGLLDSPGNIIQEAQSEVDELVAKIKGLRAELSGGGGNPQLDNLSRQGFANSITAEAALLAQGDRAFEIVRAQHQREVDAEAEKYATLDLLARQHSDHVIQIDEETFSRQQELLDFAKLTRISAFEDSFGVLSTLAAEGSALQKGLFIAEKAAAILRIRINTEVAAVRALSDLGPIAGPPMSAAIRAQGLVSQGLVVAQGIGQLAGQAHAGLSSVPREGTYLLDQGERVVSPQQNRDLTEFLRRSSTTNINVKINQAPGSNSEYNVRQVQDERGDILLMIDERVRRVVGEDVSSGRGVASAFEQMYGVRRRGAV